MSYSDWSRSTNGKRRFTRTEKIMISFQMAFLFLFFTAWLLWTVGK